MPTGDLWIGDVGQGTIEEIDKLTAGQIVGANLGWPAFEGKERFRDDVGTPTDAVPPVFEYSHDEGQSVVGGYVYRGAAIPALRGAYFFADTYAGQLRAIAVDGTTATDERDLGKVPGGQVSSFARGPGGRALRALAVGRRLPARSVVNRRAGAVVLLVALAACSAAGARAGRRRPPPPPPSRQPRPRPRHRPRPPPPRRWT